MRPNVITKSDRKQKVRAQHAPDAELPVERRNLTPNDRAVRERIAARQIADRYVPRVQVAGAKRA
jgi:hypothetical protein